MAGVCLAGCIRGMVCRGVVCGLCGMCVLCVFVWCVGDSFMWNVHVLMYLFSVAWEYYGMYLCVARYMC